MRTDEKGDPCPATLGEYRDFCAALGGEECEAVKLLDVHIAKSGRDDLVIVPDSQMRMLLMPRLVPPRPSSSTPSSYAKGPHDADAMMSMWIVYERPRDFPDSYVARRWEVQRNNPEPMCTPEILVSQSLDRIRLEMDRRCLFRIEPTDSDDPAILEIWL